MNIAVLYSLASENHGEMSVQLGEACPVHNNMCAVFMKDYNVLVLLCLKWPEFYSSVCGLSYLALDVEFVSGDEYVHSMSWL